MAKFNGINLFEPGTVSQPGIGFIGDTDTGLYDGGGGQLAVTVGGKSAALFTSAGLTLAGSLSVGGELVMYGGLTVEGGQEVSMGFNVVNDVATPQAATDAANKQYVDSAMQGQSEHPSCLAATTGDETYTISDGSVTEFVSTTTVSGTSGTPGIDGVALGSGGRVLIKDAPSASGPGSAMSDQPANGIYTITGVSGSTFSVARASDMNASADLAGAFTFIEQGDDNGGNGFLVIQPVSGSSSTIGTTGVQWTQVTGAGQITAGAGLTKAGNTISLSTPVSVADGGLGNSPTLAVGDLLYAYTTSEVGVLPPGTAGYSLTSNGPGAAPTYQQTSLADGVTGILPVVNGGTGQTSIAGLKDALEAASAYTYSWAPSGSANSVTFTPSVSPVTAGCWNVTVINTTTATAQTVEYCDVAINASTGAITVTWANAPTSGTTYDIVCVG